MLATAGGLATLLAGALILDSDRLGLTGALVMCTSAILGNLVSLKKGSLWHHGGFVYLKENPIMFFLLFILWFGGCGWLLVNSAAALWGLLGG